MPVSTMIDGQMPVSRSLTSSQSRAPPDHQQHDQPPCPRDTSGLVTIDRTLAAVNRHAFTFLGPDHDRGNFAANTHAKVP